MAFSTTTYALSKKYTEETCEQFGFLKGANCKIKTIVHENGQNIVTFEWKNDEGETRESIMYVQDGTPIYNWESGDRYEYGDLVIYASCFYRCIVANSDTVFDDTKWNELGSPDGNYDIVQNSSLLPPRFTAADRKMYYSIADGFFWLWDGSNWVPQREVVQYTTLPTPSATYVDRVVQYIGVTTPNYIQGFFYRCYLDEGDYIWSELATQRIDELTSQQMEKLLSLL